MVKIITGSTQKPVSSERLKGFFNQQSDYHGFLYIGYPIIGTVKGAYPIDALWISAEKGVVVFNLIEGKVAESYEEAQDDCANKVEAKLKGHNELTRKRQLMVDVNVVTFAPVITNLSQQTEGYPLCNETNICNVLDGFEWKNSEYYQHLVSVLQSISTIRKGRRKREVSSSTSRGGKLKNLEDSIANLDNQQSQAVIETVEGVQRIRGLAGSGKTIVLALKAAYLHAQHPEWKIAVTFNTRSLKGQFRQLINTFYIEQTNDEPDWENLQIIHAWGASGGNEKNGLYYYFCLQHNIEYMDFSTARHKFGNNDTFGKICEKAIKDAEEYKPTYDAILIDEAQDFSPSFLIMCYELLKKPKRLVYAYDELQNLSLQSLPAPEKLFGPYPDGRPRVQFTTREAGQPQQDIILQKCYRNSRPALVAAHALGFGIYREPNPSIGTGLVQMFEQSSLWQDIGYEINDGELSEGKHVVLQRTSKSSPEFLEKHSEIDDLLMFKTFSSLAEQSDWVANEIEKNLKTDELRPDDIIVINPNPFTTREAVAPIRALLFEKQISSHTAGIDTSPDVFFSNDNSVAFTGIYRAKGNEAAMVYVINAQSCYNSSVDMAKIRNQLFTAITRSKAWVRVVGVGASMKGLVSEYAKVKEKDFKLDFIYPTEEQRKHLKIINRDMNEDDKSKVKKAKASIATLISNLETGDVYYEDLEPEQLKKLRDLLDRQEG